jgi:hypothetical protein
LAEREVMRPKTKDRIIDWLLVLFFLLIVAGSGYFIIRVMTSWRVKGLG